MTAAPEHLALAAGFDVATREQWRVLVRSVLDRAGTPYPAAEPEAALVGHTDEGVPVQALYTAEDVAGLDRPDRRWPGAIPDDADDTDDANNDAAAGWDVRQRHGGADPGEVNRAVRTDLENGVTSLWLAVGDDSFPPDRLAPALDGVYLDLAPIALDAGRQTLAAGAALVDLLTARGVEPAVVRGTLGADPVGLALRAGTPPELAVAVQSMRRAAPFPHLRAVTIDATIYHDAGAGEAEELAVATSAAVACVRAATEAGIEPAVAVASIAFRFAVTDDQFVSMAKLRAARRIWARVGELSGAPGRPQHQHAVTSAAMMTRRDPWVNLLRTTLAAFAAAAGGADAITVAPFDAATGAPDAFGRRLARNTHALLHDEVGLARVADPGAGSWYVDALTEQIAQAAWARFTALERAGGAAAAGTVAELLAGTRQRRADAIARRQRLITGVSAFPDLAEVAPRPPDPGSPDGGLPDPGSREGGSRDGGSPDGGPSAPGSRDGGSPDPGSPDGPSDPGLPTVRYAEPFEALRDRSDAHLAATGHRPVVLLATPAPGVDPWVNSAVDLLRTGGIGSTTLHGDPAAVASAVTTAGADVASAADEATARALVAGGARLVAIEAGADAVAVLDRILGLVGA